MFKLEMVENTFANPVYFFYDPHTSTIIDVDGNDIMQEYVENSKLSTVNKISPENPGTKSHNVKTLKIQLGMGCNYSCSYCSQKDEVKFGSKTSIKDAEIFLSKLDSWLRSEPEWIEFWGGEPLLYWNKIKFLLDELSKKFPETKYSIITNGSLIDDEFIEYVEKYDINVSISHDGPGQSVRGPDPFDDDKQYEMIKKLYSARKKKLSFNSVLTPHSFDIEKIVEFFQSKFDENVNVNLEGVVVNYEDGQNNYFTEEQYAELTQSVVKAGLQPKNKLLPCFAKKIDNFINSLLHKTPSDFVGQKCGMDSEDNIAVDLLGNVMTCQNTGSLGKHRIGHIQDFDNIKLNTSKHWSHRDECSECPVLQLCAGSCMFVEGQQWYHSCNNEYYYNIGILGAAMFHLTGLFLTNVSGKIRRPNPEQYGIK